LAAKQKKVQKNRGGEKESEAKAESTKKTNAN
jgi:hypothetical protein